MRVENEIGNLVYDSEHPMCSIEVCSAQGEMFAFITAMDVGIPHFPLKEPRKKRYWGRFSWEDEAGSIAAILRNGGKWPSLKAG